MKENYLFKLSNGKYGIYSTELSEIVYWNLTKDEYLDAMLEKQRKELSDEFDFMVECDKKFAESGMSNKDISIGSAMPIPTVNDILIPSFLWDENTLTKQIIIMRECGASKETINEIVDKWEKGRNCKYSLRCTSNEQNFI